MGSDRIITTGSTWGNLVVSHITGSTNRIVVDRTGLEGKFDISLRWTPDLPPGADPAAGENRVSLFTALQEQLGLKLEPDIGPVEMIVIENVSRPTPD